mmetsp:Transcript_28194/g.47890  ORF Transcript_28194/g.47890 Transcript_28194/m.47890 type:complete len:93 (+) Transcript_28194:68-346(+)
MAAAKLLHSKTCLQPGWALPFLDRPRLQGDDSMLFPFLHDPDLLRSGSWRAEVFLLHVFTKERSVEKKFAEGFDEVVAEVTWPSTAGTNALV